MVHSFVVFVDYDSCHLLVNVSETSVGISDLRFPAWLSAVVTTLPFVHFLYKLKDPSPAVWKATMSYFSAGLFEQIISLKPRYIINTYISIPFRRRAGRCCAWAEKYVCFWTNYNPRSNSLFGCKNLGKQCESTKLLSVDSLQAVHHVDITDYCVGPPRLQACRAAA